MCKINFFFIVEGNRIVFYRREGAFCLDKVNFSSLMNWISLSSFQSSKGIPSSMFFLWVFKVKRD